MTDTSYHSGGDEDLPRTVRQQKEARARDQLARESTLGARPATGANRTASPSSIGNHLEGDYRAADLPLPQSPPGEYPLSTVARLQVPFSHLVVFFLKAVVAAIPALILLTLLLWGFGQILKHYLPWLIQMKIAITF